MLRQIREKLDRIRAEENRPIIGLVLSGGGAKGAAEAGALKYLKEQGIPFDFVCGTSIGGLVGGLVSTGYDGDEIIEIFKSQNWDYILSDKVDGSYIPLATKAFRAKYVLAVPFHYESSVLASRTGLAEDLKLARKVREDMEKMQSASSPTINRLAASLPSGYAYGFNVGNLISSLTVGYQDSIAFRDLPMPYMSVATDMVSGRAKFWGSGSLKNAMRSTMSIPGLFTPVRTDDMVLTDGGMRDNYPTDLARAVGCDYIVGIELSNANLEYSQVNNVGDIIGQGISMLGRDAFERNINTEDIFIKPQLEGFNMLSFNDVAIDTMVNRGYAAAVAKADEIKALKERLGDAVQKYGGRHATNLEKEAVTVGTIEFIGISDADSKYLMRKIGIKAGDKVDKEIMNDAMSKLQATGTFESVGYTLLGSEEPYTLHFNCNPGPTNQVALGFRLDTEEWASLLLHVGLNTRKLTGPKAEFSAKIGQNLRTDLHLSVNPHWMPTVNLDASFDRYLGNVTGYMSDVSYNARYIALREKLYLSDIKWTNFNFRLGVQNRYFQLAEDTVFGQYVSQLIGKEALAGDYLGAFAVAELNTFDKFYFPSKGIKFGFNADYDFYKPGSNTFDKIFIAGVDFKSVIPVFKGLAIIPEFHARNVFNGAENTSAIHANYVGGMLPGRYVEYQLPFFGINGLMISQDMTATLTLEMRTNPFKDVYVSALGGYLKSAEDIKDMTIGDMKPDCWAVGLEAAYDSIIGPIRFNVHWSDYQKWGFYASLGFDF